MRKLMHVLGTIMITLLLMGGGAMAPALAVPAEWSVPMTSTTATEGSNLNLEFGTNASATDDYDGGIDVPHPPPGPGVQSDAYFPINHLIFTGLDKDYRTPADSIQWTLHVESSSEEITLTWDATGVPANYSLTLIGAGPDIDMKAVPPSTVLGAGIHSLTIRAAVIPPPQPPVADPNGPYSGTTGTPVALDGSASSDADGTIVSYHWDFGDSNVGTGATPTHSYADPGTYTVTLTVTDDDGLTDTETTTAEITDETDILRELPSPPLVLEEETFDVTVTFTAPSDGLNAIGLSDFAPSGWTVEVNPDWCDPTPMDSLAPDTRADYVWGGPYDAGQPFTATYRVTVPLGAALGTYDFSGTIEYYIGSDGPFIFGISGDSQVEVVEGAQINGKTHEVNGSILPEVTITIDGEGSVISDEEGAYQIIVLTTKLHTVTASKSGFRSQTQTINVTNIGATYILDFKASYGLVPNAPNLSYVLNCINKWKFPPDEFGLALSKVLSVINAWKFPI